MFSRIPNHLHFVNFPPDAWIGNLGDDADKKKISEFLEHKDSTPTTGADDRERPSATHKKHGGDTPGDAEAKLRDGTFLTLLGLIWCLNIDRHASLVSSSSEK